MKAHPLRISYFGEASGSTNRSKSACYYRKILSGLSRAGHQLICYEPAAGPQEGDGDLPPVDGVDVVTYEPAFTNGIMAAISAARGSGVILKAGVVGVHDTLLEAALVDLKTEDNLLIFWDADPQETLESLHGTSTDPFLRVLPAYDLVLLPDLLPEVVAAYTYLGARHCMATSDTVDVRDWLSALPGRRFAD